ncbi:DUF456 domain-containing protein [Pengzhenrongella frigida]|uniref:DUF456 domain-containing protein n=1 Tax=Pengzhenrongella frigida TaxID=1259133 RepID=A0A4Q5N258_9MICO|nr:DUF456 domain-containing protein [Cellulomonas sp. HLT2-17]RYV52210.1 DUF456 domain-containing protein [Cellulomonas sp. HLT2-17]
MSAGGELVVGLVLLVGLFGVVVQVLPGGLLILGAIAVWAVVTGTGWGWAVLAVAVVATAVAGVAKYVIASHHLRGAGVPSSTLVWGGLAGVVGFFVIPVVGLPVGFILAVYLAELARLRSQSAAWTSTVAALRATGITILVELAGALIAVGAWLLVVLLT